MEHHISDAQWEHFSMNTDMSDIGQVATDDRNLRSYNNSIDDIMLGKTEP